MLDDHEVKEIARWYEVPIFANRLRDYMISWMLTQSYISYEADINENNYFNYALNKQYITLGANMFNNGGWGVDIAPKGRAWLDEQKN